MMAAEAHHFKRFGYQIPPATAVALALFVLAPPALFSARRKARRLVLAVAGLYSAGMVLAICAFPLNYLRSDMLPVIEWADTRLLHQVNPYSTIHVSNRLYDFPYLPGMLVAFLPAAALHVDLRLATLAFSLGACALVYTASSAAARLSIASLLALFLLCPFLQYRHDLYLQPHWFTLTLAAVLMQRRRLGWSALVWGISCAIYQLSWVMLPFFLLYAYRGKGAREAFKLGAVSLLGFLVVVGPFLSVARHQVASNTVSQWSKLPHALADPINISYWLTYFVRPDHLQWIQAVVLTTLFVLCYGFRRCSSLEDTLRFMSVALAVFIPMNVLVDGYFYLTLSLVVLLYICVASGAWTGSTAEASSRGSEERSATVA